MRVDYEELQEIRLKSREALTKAKAVESGPIAYFSHRGVTFKVICLHKYDDIVKNVVKLISGEYYNEALELHSLQCRQKAIQQLMINNLNIDL